MKTIINIKDLSFKQIMLILSGICLIVTVSLYRYFDQTLPEVVLDNEIIKNQMEGYYLEQWPDIKNPITLTDEQLTSIDTMLKNMSLAQKIGQMISVPSYYDDAQLLDLNIGNIHYDRFVISEKQSRLISQNDEFYESIFENSHNKQFPYIPPFICMSQSVGNYLDTTAVMFANSYAIGAANDTELTTELGQAIAEQLLSTGFNCVSNNDINYSISEHPLKSIQLLSSYYAGLLSQPRVFSVVNISVSDDINFDTDKNYLSNNYLHALNFGALGVNIEQFDSADVKNNTITNLKEKMHFKGVVIASANLADSIDGCWVGQCDRLINSGVDVVMLAPSSRENDRVDEFINNTIQSVKNGKIKISRIDDAIKRILSVKMSLGLFDGLLPSEISDQMIGYKKIIDSHEQLANKLVKKSTVLLKNENNIIPMNRTGNYLIAGEAIGDSIYQLGYPNNKNGVKFGKAFVPYTDGATIIDPLYLNEYRVLESLMNQHYKSTMKINRELVRSPIQMELIVPAKEQLKIDKLNAEEGTDLRYEFSGKEYDMYLEKYREKIREYVSKFDRLIYVMNEPTQEELVGFNAFLNGPPITQSNLLEVIEELDIEIVVVYLSTKPNAVPVAMNQADAFIMAWRPGSEINALMDLLFRDKNDEAVSDFSGILSSTWPMRSCDFYNFIASETHDSKFPYGYGLSVQDKAGDWIELNEYLNFCQYRR
ncbi:glycoside hydrolase family 3 C-terminal domain-containing protein [Marinicellulosiphila megalodicopiae]|uniref:glycoside hydrolase family 3 C-terminal domain-containing protein n=1 Tax=Marinicellulosiphila megalodicopiae TaxID=2724896 RepID=UPI003BB01BDA